MRTPPDWPARDLLAHRVAASPDRTALVETAGGESWTYRELDAHVDDVAADLARVAADAGGSGDGGGAGTAVGVLLSARVAFVVLVHAAMRRGLRLVPLDVRLSVPELRAQVERADPAVLVCGAATEADARAAADCPVVSVDEPAREGVEPLRRGGDDAASSAVASSTVASSTGGPSPPGSDDPPLSRDDAALVLFTSGTTGDPKAVELTVGNLVASATASAVRLGVDPNDRWLVPLPLYHMGGLAPLVRSAMYGTAVVLESAFDPVETARAVEAFDATGVSLVPTMLRRLLDAGWSPPPALRFVLVGGAPTPPDLVERCRAAGVPVCPTYGTTETASQVATARPAEAYDHPASVGRPLLFTDVTVVDGAGDPLPPGETGELVVDGPTVTPGYRGDPAATAAAFGEHGFHTGDVGYRDGAGRLWVLGRVDDRIVTGGENVYPGEVAAVLRDHPGVAAAAVVGLPDPEWGERVAALVVPANGGSDGGASTADAATGDGSGTGDEATGDESASDDGTADDDAAGDGSAVGGESTTADEATAAPTAEDLRDHCEGRLAGFKRPKTVAFADELPRTASGTVKRDAVRERLREARGE